MTSYLPASLMTLSFHTRPESTQDKKKKKKEEKASREEETNPEKSERSDERKGMGERDYVRRQEG